VCFVCSLLSLCFREAADYKYSQGTYVLSAWEKLNLDCTNWTCTNGLWPKGTIYSNTTTVCKPGTVSFGSSNTKVQKME